jgi:hypothetical protein
MSIPAVHAAIKEGRMPKIPKDISPELARLIQRCWDNGPEERPLFDEIVNEPQKLLFPTADENAYFDFIWDLVQQYKVD